MSQVNVINVIVQQPRTRFTDPLTFEIFFEALQPLQHSLTWRIMYIGQASNPQYDQVLEEAEMDCSQPGQMQFRFDAPAPNPAQIPEADVVGVTAVLLTCSYNGDQEFLRVGYYVNVEYDTPEMNEFPPNKPEIDKLQRHILAEKPRVTKFQIDWDDQPEQFAQMQNSEEGIMQKGTQMIDRQNMMGQQALAEAAQNFSGQM